MDSDEELLEAAGGEPFDEPYSKRRRTVDTTGFEDIARELEEGTDVQPEGEGEGGDTTQDEEDDPEAWLLQQYPSESGPEEGMDVDLDGGGAERKVVVVVGAPKDDEEEKDKEKATYTSSGRLLVPSHKSREAKAVAGATAAMWADLEMEGMNMVPVEKKKPSGSKSKSKSGASKTPGAGSGSGTPQPRPAGSKPGGTKIKSSAVGVNKSAAAALAAASKSSGSKSKKKADPTKKVKDKEARSRSESRQAETPAPELPIPKVTVAEPEVEQEQDSRLYCVCKTRYDEEKVMIACDRCDDWYHPGCVNLSESDVDLIDQFVCPLCVIKYNARTSYKTRCAVKGCNKPARAPISKYCSDVCGLKSATVRLETLRSQGVDLDQLWYAVKDARPAEGVVYIHLPGPVPHPPPPGVNNIGPGATRVLDGRQKADLDRLSRLTGESKQLQARRATLEQEIAYVKARLRLLNCAMQRNERVGGEKCGFDPRIVMEDEDWAEWVDTDGKWAMEEDEGEETKAKQLAAYEKMEKSLCGGKKRCDRHYGWQNLKFADFSAEAEAKQTKLDEVTSKHQDLGRRIVELRNDMTSLSRHPAERVVPPPLPDESLAPA